MPELHKLTTVLGVLQDRGHKVALVTDGRMSGASGKVPAAIHVTPEALEGGAIAKMRDGDIDPARRRGGHAGSAGAGSRARAARERFRRSTSPAMNIGFGRELFAGFRQMVGRADHGASAFGTA